jgi:magnesium chelatase family protein
VIAQLFSTTLVGVEAKFVQVEVALSPGLPSFHIVGLPDTAVSEAIHRVRCALRAAGHPLPPRRCTVNLAPADLRKEGPRFDLAIALGILAAQDQIAPESLDRTLILGELSLTGALRPVYGALNSALVARQAGFSRLILPRANASELPPEWNLEVCPAESLEEVLGWISGRPLEPASPALVAPAYSNLPDLSQVSGQPLGRRALEIAACGGHHLLLMGPPGSGKTLLSRCLPRLLPTLTSEQALEVAAVRSALGLLETGRHPPFCEPHCHITAPALLGGNRPGEISRAHHGVLFIDELPEVSRDCLEGLRTALELGWVAVGRARHSWRFPARFQLVAACNPCPCGYFGDELRGCHCSPPIRRRYLSKLSGPIRDRLDLQLFLHRPEADQLWQATPGESSAAVAERVQQVRDLQQRRGLLNRDLGREFFLQSGQVSEWAWKLLRQQIERYQLSGRAGEKLLRLARTVADMENSPGIEEQHLAEMSQYRHLDRSAEVPV